MVRSTVQRRLQRRRTRPSWVCERLSSRLPERPAVDHASARDCFRQLALASVKEQPRHCYRDAPSAIDHGKLASARDPTSPSMFADINTGLFCLNGAWEIYGLYVG